MDDSNPELTSEPPSLLLMTTPMLPPPTHAIELSSTSSSSLGKRKRDNQAASRRSSPLRRPSSTRSTAFSASTREQVKRLDNGDRCWHCAATPTDVCHVVTKVDREFDVYRIRGLISIDTPSHINNAVPLCALCHRNFDDHCSPGFVFIPADIAYFRSYEKQDMERRRTHFEHHRTRLKRICPSADEYRQHQLAGNCIEESDHGGLYERFILRDYFPQFACCERSKNPRVGQLFPAAPWHGDPMAALRRGFAILGNIALSGIPLVKRRELQELHNLYMENDESLAAKDDGFGDQVEDGDGRNRGPLGDMGEGPPRPPSDDIPASETEQPPDTAADGTHTAGRLNSKAMDGPQLSSNYSVPTLKSPDSIISPASNSSPQSSLTPCSRDQDHRKARPHNSTSLSESYKWGPLGTAQDAVKFYTSVKHLT